MKKTNRKWKTVKCGRCGESHVGYTGKLDSRGIEYVICGKTHKRMNVMRGNLIDEIYKTKWELMIECSECGTTESETFVYRNKEPLCYSCYIQETQTRDEEIP